MAFLAIVLALAALWHAARDGKLVGLAVKAASHSLGSGLPVGALQDVLLF